jgi:hypothetical protein
MSGSSPNHHSLVFLHDSVDKSVEDGLSGIVNMTSGKISPEFPSGGDQLISAAFTNFGIPITGSIAAGFVIGFIKGLMGIVDLHMTRSRSVRGYFHCTGNNPSNRIVP